MWRLCENHSPEQQTGTNNTIPFSERTVQVCTYTGKAGVMMTPAEKARAAGDPLKKKDPKTQSTKSQNKVLAAKNRDGNLRRKRKCVTTGELKTGEDEVSSVEKTTDRARVPHRREAVRLSASPGPVASQDKWKYLLALRQNSPG